MSPTVIITRPAPQGRAFADELSGLWGGDLRVIVSPLLQVVPLQVEVPDVAGVVFTSANGVAQAVRLGLPLGLPAFCVGDRTAAVAADAGFCAVTGPGNAKGLIKTIIDSHTSGPLAHIRGRHARGDVAATLTAADIPCSDVIAYDQKALPLTPAAKLALADENPVIFPLFSPRTATILSGQGPFAAPLHVVAISTAALPELPVMSSRVADQQTGNAMRAATIACLNALNEQHG